MLKNQNKCQMKITPVTVTLSSSAHKLFPYELLCLECKPLVNQGFL